MKSKIVIIILFIFVVFVSGCVNDTNVTELLKQSQQGKEFLSTYPNADIVAVYLSNETIASIIDKIRQECDSSIPIKPYWKAKFFDPDTNTELISWIDAETQDVVCFIKKGSKDNEQQSAQEIETNKTIEVSNPEQNNELEDFESGKTIKICPDNCDDNNVCTNDYCSESSNYMCTHDPIIPCCGNNVCEDGEDYNSCSDDCKIQSQLEPPSISFIEDNLGNKCDVKPNFNCFSSEERPSIKVGQTLTFTIIAKDPTNDPIQYCCFSSTKQNFNEDCWQTSNICTWKVDIDDYVSFPYYIVLIKDDNNHYFHGGVEADQEIHLLYTVSL